jgi:hypothetical protein
VPIGIFSIIPQEQPVLQQLFLKKSNVIAGSGVVYCHSGIFASQKTGMTDAKRTRLLAMTVIAEKKYSL